MADEPRPIILNEDIQTVLQYKFSDAAFARVEQYIKRLSTVALAVLAIVSGGAGLTFYKIIDDKVSKLVTERVDEEIGKQTEAIRKVTVDVTKLLTDTMMSQLNTASETAAGLKVKMQEVDSLIKELQSLASDAQTQATDLKKREDQIIAALASAQTEMGDAQKAAEDFITNSSTEIEAFQNRLSSVLNVQSSAITELQNFTKADAGKDSALAQVAALENATQSGDPGSDTSKSAIVFLEFSGEVLREDMQKLADTIQKGPFVIPGIERHGSHVREIRYYYAEDLARAQDLKARTEAALREMGYPGMEIKIQDLTKWTLVKPRQGTMEIWLNLPKPKI